MATAETTEQAAAVLRRHKKGLLQSLCYGRPCTLCPMRNSNSCRLDQLIEAIDVCIEAIEQPHPTEEQNDRTSHTG